MRSIDWPEGRMAEDSTGGIEDGKERSQGEELEGRSRDLNCCNLAKEEEKVHDALSPAKVAQSSRSPRRRMCKEREEKEDIPSLSHRGGYCK